MLNDTWEVLWPAQCVELNCMPSCIMLFEWQDVVIMHVKASLAELSLLCSFMALQYYPSKYVLAASASMRGHNSSRCVEIDIGSKAVSGKISGSIWIKVIPDVTGSFWLVDERLKQRGYSQILNSLEVRLMIDTMQETREFLTTFFWLQTGDC